MILEKFLEISASHPITNTVSVCTVAIWRGPKRL